MVSEALLLLLGTVLGGAVTLGVQYVQQRWTREDTRSARVWTARSAERERQMEPVRALSSSMNRLTAQIKLERTVATVVQQAARSEVDSSVWDVIKPSLQMATENSAASQIFGVDQARSEAVRAAPTEEIRTAIEEAYVEAMLYFHSDWQDVPTEKARRLAEAIESYLLGD